MESSMIDLLLNGSPMVAFASFLIYLYRTQQSRMDTLVDKFQSQIEIIRSESKSDSEGLRKESKDDLQVIRDRYDIILQEAKDDIELMRKRYDSATVANNLEKDRIQFNIENKLENLAKKLDELSSSLT